MGREVRRVPLDFDWPVGPVWKGYMNPYSPTKCRVCDGCGLNSETKKLQDEWYSFGKPEWVYSDDGKRRYNALAWSNNLDEDDVKALVDGNRLWDWTRRPRNAEQEAVIKETGKFWLPENNGYIPTPEEVNEWNRWGMGHDSCNQWICVKAKAERLGVYGNCPVCDGHGNYFCDEKYRKLSDEWEGFDPPKGPGYQLWETTSEGSAMSPVFETPEELARWLADTGASSFGSSTESYETWLDFVRGPGWAPSAVSTGGVLNSGVSAAVEVAVDSEDGSSLHLPPCTRDGEVYTSEDGKAYICRNKEWIQMESVPLVYHMPSSE